MDRVPYGALLVTVLAALATPSNGIVHRL